MSSATRYRTWPRFIAVRSAQPGERLARGADRVAEVLARRAAGVGEGRPVRGGDEVRAAATPSAGTRRRCTACRSCGRSMRDVVTPSAPPRRGSVARRSRSRTAPRPAGSPRAAGSASPGGGSSLVAGTPSSKTNPSNPDGDVMTRTRDGSMSTVNVCGMPMGAKASDAGDPRSGPPRRRGATAARRGRRTPRPRDGGCGAAARTCGSRRPRGSRAGRRCPSPPTLRVNRPPIDQTASPSPGRTRNPAVSGPRAGRRRAGRACRPRARSRTPCSRRTATSGRTG